MIANYSFKITLNTKLDIFSQDKERESALENIIQEGKLLMQLTDSGKFKFKVILF